jgi:3-deoxy-D-manno-octulosonic-acid transferase
VANFAAISQMLLQEAAAVRVSDPDKLAESVDRLLSDEQARKALAERGREVAEREAGVLDRVLRELDPLLARAAEAEEADART